MPSCKAKYCTVTRGMGISCFTIPDPKKNRQLCKQWIHNLGTKNLDIKTFVYSKSNIVCAKHFEEDCFKEDLKAKYLGYTPKYRYLKPNAVPTIFVDSKPVKRRIRSEKRIEKKGRKDSEIIDSLFSDNQSVDSVSCDNNNLDVVENSAPTREPAVSSDESPEPLDLRINTRSDTSTCVSLILGDSQPNCVFTNQNRKPRKSKKPIPERLRSKEISKMKEIGVQVSKETSDKKIQCHFPIDYALESSCVDCFASENPNIGICDPLYRVKKSERLI